MVLRGEDTAAGRLWGRSGGVKAGSRTGDPDLPRLGRSLTSARPAAGFDTIGGIVSAEARFTRAIRAGERIFQEGDAAATIFVVRKGRVRISKHVRGGEKTLAVLGPGDLFGEMAVITGAPRSATAEAVDDVTVIELDAARFEKMVLSEAEIAVRVLRNMALRLAEADSLIAILTKRDPRTRVILGLLREAERHGEPGAQPDSVVVKRDLEDLAEELGVKRTELDEAITRMIRVGAVRPVVEGLELASPQRLGEFLSFLEDKGIVHD